MDSNYTSIYYITDLTWGRTYIPETFGIVDYIAISILILFLISIFTAFILVWKNRQLIPIQKKGWKYIFLGLTFSFILSLEITGFLYISVLKNQSSEICEILMFVRVLVLLTHITQVFLYTIDAISHYYTRKNIDSHNSNGTKISLSILFGFSAIFLVVGLYVNNGIFYNTESLLCDINITWKSVFLVYDSFFLLVQYTILFYILACSERYLNKEIEKCDYQTIKYTCIVIVVMDILWCFGFFSFSEIRGSFLIGFIFFQSYSMYSLCISRLLYVKSKEYRMKYISTEHTEETLVSFMNSVFTSNLEPDCILGSGIIFKDFLEYCKISKPSLKNEIKFLLKIEKFKENYKDSSSITGACKIFEKYVIQKSITLTIVLIRNINSKLLKTTDMCLDKDFFSDISKYLLNRLKTSYFTCYYENILYQRPVFLDRLDILLEIRPNDLNRETAAATLVLYNVIDIHPKNVYTFNDDTNTSIYEEEMNYI